MSNIINPNRNLPILYYAYMSQYYFKLITDVKVIRNTGKELEN